VFREPTTITARQGWGVSRRTTTTAYEARCFPGVPPPQQSRAGVLYGPTTTTVKQGRGVPLAYHDHSKGAPPRDREVRLPLSVGQGQAVLPHPLQSRRKRKNREYSIASHNEYCCT